MPPRICLSLSLVAFALLLGGCNSSDDSDGSPQTLVVGMEMAYPPFEMRGADNEPDGISVRMAEDLGKFLGRPVELRDVEWSGIIPALTSGKIDLIISSMTRTAEREKTIAFSDNYVTNGLCMLVGVDSPIQSVADLKAGQHKVAVKLATTGQQWAKDNLPGVDLILLDDAGACAVEVVQGKVDAFIYDQISIYQYWKAHVAETRPILQPIREESWAVGMRHGEDALKNEVNRFLAFYRESGGFEVLAERYMAEPKEAFEGLGVPFIFH